MAKTKNKKKVVSDKVRGKKKETATKINPFEVKVNRQKHHVLGKKVTKFDKGMPGVSKSKAIKKVRTTYLVLSDPAKDWIHTLLELLSGLTPRSEV